MKVMGKLMMASFSEPRLDQQDGLRRGLASLEPQVDCEVFHVVVSAKDEQRQDMPAWHCVLARRYSSRRGTRPKVVDLPVSNVFK